MLAQLPNQQQHCCREYLEKEVADSPIERPIYMLGESFGGVVALAAAAERADLVDRIVLVNPATSFPRSIWPRLGPLLPQVPKVSPHPSIPPHPTPTPTPPFHFHISYLALSCLRSPILHTPPQINCKPPRILTFKPPSLAHSLNSCPHNDTELL
jgi:pimeloyl-ACP methyl ester carboxylesterase